MRKLKIALLVASTAVSLFSLRDKATVTTVTNTNPPVAEAYHAPAWMQSKPVSAENLIMPSTVVRTPPQLSTGSPPAPFAESDLLSQESYIVGSAGSEPAKLVDANAVPIASSEKPAPKPAAETPTTLIYGFVGGDSSTGTNNAENAAGGGGTSSLQSASVPETAGAISSVSVTGLMPNGGIPGTNIVIQGAGFNSTASNNDVKFGTVSSGSVTYVSANQLRATVPQSGLSPGLVNVSVTVNNVTSNKALFSVLKSSAGNVFDDNTQSLLPGGLTLTNSSIVRSGDADNDNDLDLFIVDVSAGAAHLLINNGQGTFSDATSTNLPAIPNSSLITDAIFGDVNKDGYPDILLAYSSGQSVRLLLNDGHGKFNDFTGTNLPAISGNAVSIDLGDSNGDGAPDVIIANNNVRDTLLINDGSGIFVVDVNFDLPGTIDGSSDIRFCDLNGDGALDIITTNNEVIGSSSLRNRVYMNDGQGQFTDNTENVLPEDNEYSEVLDCGDIDADGDIDVIVANDNQNAVLINEGNGVFEDQTDARMPTNYFASKDTKLGDMNGDGYLDIVVLGESRMSLLFNDGQGSFKTDGSIKLPDYKSIPAVLGGKNIQVADMDGDGSLDIIIGGEDLHILVSKPSNKAPVLAPIGNQTVASGKSLTFNISAEDPNGDEITLLAENLPGAATFRSPIFDWTPTSSDIGQHSGVRFIARENTQTALEDSETITITVTGSGLPVIDSHIPDEFDLNLTIGDIELFGLSAHDPDNKPLTFRWFLNDVEIPSSSGASSSIIFIVPRVGENVIEARVENSIGSVSALWHVDVGAAVNQPPSITSYSPNQSIVNIDLSAGGGFSFGVTAADPELDSLSYAWKFNNVALSSSGANLNSSAFMGSVGTAGDYPLEVSVSDGHNTSVKHSWTIHVTQGSQNQPPSITSYSPNQSIVNIDLSAGGGFSFGVTATDPELDSLSYAWKFNNVALPSSGANLNSSAFMGSVGTAGDYPLEVSVSDGHNTSVKHSWTIHVTQGSTNHAPVAVNDAISTTINTSTDIDVLSNDSDIDGNALTISASSLTQPSHGTAVIVSNKIRYTPTDGYTGSDSFTYKATDGLLESGTATVTITIEQSTSYQLVKKSFNYFWNETDNPETGFTRDRLAVDAANRNSDYDSRYNMASMAATGFGLSAMCVAAEKYGDGSDPDWQVTKDQLRARVGLVMDSLLEIQGKQNPNDESALAKWGKDGFFYHFVNIETGERWVDASNRSEVSTIDTAIVVAGVLTAGEYFGGDLKDKAMLIYRNVNWDAFLDKNLTAIDHHIAANLNYNHMYHAWNPDRPAADRFYGHWDYTSECLLLYLLAAVSPEPGHAIPPETFYAIRKELGNYGANGNAMVKSWFGSLFTYQYTQAFFNFKDAAGQTLYDKEGVDWWKNSVEAVKANKQFCNDNIENYAGQEDLWGLTSGYTSGFNYDVYGAPPAGVEIPSVDVRGADGTVHPSAVGGSIPMLPEECTRALDKMKELYDAYGYQIWGDYGFVNSFKMGADLNETPFPISSFYCAIDMGISLVMAENHNSGLIWNNFSGFEIEQGKTLKDAIIQKVGFTSDNICVVNVDDPNPESNFHMGQIDAANPTYTIRFNLDEVNAGSYLLAIHSFMAKDAGNHTISVAVKVNDVAGTPVTFEYNAAANPADSMKYIQIDPSGLKVGENTITLQWQSVSGNAKWLAWKNIEVSSPVVNSTWMVARNETANPPALFGNEYRLDDTYYAGASISTFEQAVNKDVETFTDILFYNEDTDYAALTVKVLETQDQLRNGLQIFVNGLQAPVFNGQVSEGEQLVTPGFYLEKGWNRITIYHPGTANAPSEWIRWDSVALTALEPPIISAPEGFAAASFGKNAAKLRWNSVGFAVKYNLYRSTTKGGPYTLVDDVVSPATAYTDTGLSDTTTYYYVVRAVKSDNTESQKSQEVTLTTGSYWLDYGDGHNPNIFGQDTFDNEGAPLGDNSFAQVIRYNGILGKVRVFNLAPSQKNTISLTTANINDATMLSFRVMGVNGNEKFKIKLIDGAGNQASYSMTNSTAGIWQEQHLSLQDTFSGVNLANMAAMEIISETTGQPVTLYFDEIEFNTVLLGANHLDVKIRDRITDEVATGLSFGANGQGTEFVTAAQYIDIGYQCAGNWNIIIYTDNMAVDASPKFTGTYEPGKCLASGLIGVQNSGYRVPLVWQVFQTKKYTTAGQQPPWGDFYQTGYVVDKSDWDYNKDQYSLPYRTIFDHDLNLGFPLDPARENYHLKGTLGQRLYVYLGANFEGVPAQTYTTNKLTIDIYSE